MVQLTKHDKVLPPRQNLIDRRILTDQANPPSHFIGLLSHIVTGHTDLTGIKGQVA